MFAGSGRNQVTRQTLRIVEPRRQQRGQIGERQRQSHKSPPCPAPALHPSPSCRAARLPMWSGGPPRRHRPARRRPPRPAPRAAGATGAASAPAIGRPARQAAPKGTPMSVSGAPPAQDPPRRQPQRVGQRGQRHRRGQETDQGVEQRQGGQSHHRQPRPALTVRAARTARPPSRHRPGSTNGWPSRNALSALRAASALLATSKSLSTTLTGCHPRRCQSDTASARATRLLRQGHLLLGQLCLAHDEHRSTGRGRKMSWEGAPQQRRHGQGQVAWRHRARRPSLTAAARQHDGRIR